MKTESFLILFLIKFVGNVLCATKFASYKFQVEYAAAYSTLLYVFIYTFILYIRMNSRVCTLMANDKW